MSNKIDNNNNRKKKKKKKKKKRKRKKLYDIYLNNEYTIDLINNTFKRR